MEQSGPVTRRTSARLRESASRTSCSSSKASPSPLSPPDPSSTSTPPKTTSTSNPHKRLRRSPRFNVIDDGQPGDGPSSESANTSDQCDTLQIGSSQPAVDTQSVLGEDECQCFSEPESPTKQTSSRRKRKADPSIASKQGKCYFDKLPDELLVMILANVELVDLLTVVPRVCWRWFTVQKTACESRQNLTLIINNRSGEGKKGDRPLLEDDEIINSPLNAVLNPVNARGRLVKRTWPGTRMNTLNFKLQSHVNTTKLSRILPNISKLIILQQVHSSAGFRIASSLLHNWENRLVHLELWFGFPQSSGINRLVFADQDEYITAMFRRINALKAIRHLTFFFPNTLQNKAVNFELSVMERLHRFYFFSRDPMEILMNSLHRFAAPNEELREIGIGNQWGWEAFLESDSPPKIDDRITVACLLKSQAIRQLTQRFTNLTSVTMPVKRTFTELNRAARIRQLTHLNIVTHFNFCRPLAELDTIEKLPKLARVRVVHIQLTCSTHKVFDTKVLPQMFPDVRKLVLKLDMPKCSDCVALRNDTPQSKQERCELLLLESWRKCPKLKHIEVEWGFVQRYRFQ